MADLKNRVQGIEANVQARDIKGFTKGNNIYEVLAVVSKRARILNVDMKHELHSKLDEFAMSTDTIEEMLENKEQVEISKFYERLPNPVLIATHEYLNDELEYVNRNKQIVEETPKQED